MDENTVNDVPEQNVDALTTEPETGEGAAPAAEQESATPAPEQQVEPEKPRQTSEENERFRMVRQRAEQEAAQKTRREYDTILAQAYQGQTDPRTGAPITSASQVREIMAYTEAQKRSMVLQNAGLDETILNRVIAEHPAVRQAQDVIQTMNRERAVSAVNAGLKAISAIDPEVKDFADMPPDVLQRFNDAVLNKHLPFDEAYKIAAFDKLVGKKAAAAKQAAINAANGKGHLSQTAGGAGGGEVNIPPDVLAEYKRYGISEAEAKKDYARMTKGR